MGNFTLKSLKPAIFLFVATVLLSFNAQALDPNGTATYSELGSRLFLATLFLESPSESAQEVMASTQAKRIEMRFSDRVSKRRWRQTWTQSIAINSPQDSLNAAASELSDTLDTFQSGLEYGDSVVINYDPLYGTSVSVNGVKLIQEKSLTLFNLFLSAWIGSVPPNSQFKEDILGQSDTANTYTEFLAIQPAQSRIDIVKSWNTELKQEEARRLAEAKAEAEAEAKAMEKAEEEAEKQAEDQALEEAQRLALIEEQKKKAQEEAQRKAAEEKAKRLAEEKAAKEKAAEKAAKAVLVQQEYTTTVIGSIYKSVKYPSRAVKRNQTGSARALVTINKDGNIAGISMLEETKYDTLNAAVNSAINSAAPFPPVPDVLDDGQPFEIVVPVTFKLN